MYYILRDHTGEAYCAIVIPEANDVDGEVFLSPSRTTIEREGYTVPYTIMQRSNIGGALSKRIGTVEIEWDSQEKIPSWDTVQKSIVLLEKITKAQFETYVLLGLRCVTREETNPFNILAIMDI